MNRSELKVVIEKIFTDEILSKFNEKNKSYGSEKNNDAFFNFEQTGVRLVSNPNINLSELDKKLLPLFAYMDKHNVALMQGLSETVEFKERLIDNILYGFMALAIYDEYSKKTHSEDYV